MNKWQEYYINDYYDGKKPHDKMGKEALVLLGQVKDFIEVDFPKDNGTIETEKYQVTLDTCNMPNGLISVEVLVSNLRLWVHRGHIMRTY